MLDPFHPCTQHNIVNCPCLTPTVEQRVASKIEARALKGKEKYGTTMERTDLSRKEWLIHAQEEAMDLAVYLEKLIQLEGT